MKSSASEPTVIELFAGAGGLMLGLEMAGFRSLAANEVHPDPCRTLRANFSGVPVLEGSIRDLPSSEILDAAGVQAGEVSLVAGGPPCQGFSTAGIKDPADPRNTLIQDFIRVVRDVKPRFFLLENVTGLVTMHSGKLFERVLDQLAELGYRFHHKVLFAADYGVPQMRKRLIVLGSRDGAPPPFPAPTHRSSSEINLFSEDLLPYVTAGEAIADLPTVNAGETATRYTARPRTPYQKLMRLGSRVVYNHEAVRHRASTMDYYSLIPPGGTALDVPLVKRNGKQGIQRWPTDGLSRTITTEPTDFLHPSLNRVPTVRETARVQSFPDRIQFLGQRTTGNKMRRLGYCSQTQQVGNAVPPLLARAIGRSIVDMLAP